MNVNAPILTESVRIPLHELQADVDYLIGRVLADGSDAPMIAASIKDKLAKIEAALIQPQCAPDREALVRAIQLSYARKDLEPTSATTLALYREDAENAANAVLALTRPLTSHNRNGTENKGAGQS